ncbi:MAG: hypothetical protein FWH03_02420 [Firmicutes bacterium]|nr:hypothetical protein [Bacillota bacterium]
MAGASLTGWKEKQLYQISFLVSRQICRLLSTDDKSQILGFAKSRLQNSKKSNYSFHPVRLAPTMGRSFLTPRFG